MDIKIESYKKSFHFEKLDDDLGTIKNINYFINSKLQNYLIYIMKNIIQKSNFQYYDMDSIKNRYHLTVPKSKCHPDFYIKNDKNIIKYVEVKTIIGNNYKLTVDILQDTYDFMKKNYKNNIQNTDIYYVFLQTETSNFDLNTIKNYIILNMDGLKSNIESRNFDYPGSYNNYTQLKDTLFDGDNKLNRKKILNELNEYDFIKFKKNIEKGLFNERNIQTFS